MCYYIIVERQKQKKQKEVIKMKKKIDVNKIAYYVNKCLSYLGAIGFGIYLAIGIEIALDGWIIGGLIVSSLLAIMPLISNKSIQKDMEEI